MYMYSACYKLQNDTLFNQIEQKMTILCLFKEKKNNKISDLVIILRCVNAFFAAMLHFLHALRIRMLNAIRISAYGNSLYHLYMLQKYANAFTDLHCGYAIRISVYGNGP